MSNTPKLPTLPKEAHEAGRLFRQAIQLAERGEFDDAVQCVRAIEATGFKLQLVFRNEALLSIVAHCCDAGQTMKAHEIAKQINLPQFQMRAQEVIAASD
jgi:hypothetical protein